LHKRPQERLKQVICLERPRICCSASVAHSCGGLGVENSNGRVVNVIVLLSRIFSMNHLNWFTKKICSRTGLSCLSGSLLLNS